MRSNDPMLNERELLIAKTAADLAVKQITSNFYQEVGRTVVQRILTTIGILAVGIAVGKGWFKLPW